jgi:aerobic-type carbon monoxide dehydrogenase small subunit (CoxS/CutS family)
LRIAIGCACYAVPFEFRPGIVVIDLKDGRPPKGSSFENALVVVQNPVEPMAVTSTQPQANGYDWLVARQPVQTLPVPRASPDTLLTPQAKPDTSLKPLNDALLFALASGATAGIVDLALPIEGDTVVPSPEMTNARIVRGSIPGVSTSVTGLAESAPEPDIQCISPELLNLSDWGTNDPFDDQLVSSQLNLLGEFDLPAADMLASAVRLRLYGGFGAEARLLLRAFPEIEPQAKLLASMGYLIDGEIDTNAMFQEQLNCPGPASLWSLLAIDDLPLGAAADQNSVVTAFSALPTHLRQELGPRVIEKLLQLDLQSAAQSVRAATVRGTKIGSNDHALMDAQWYIYEGMPDKAIETLEQFMKEPGAASVDVLMAWVEAATMQADYVDPSVAISLESFLKQYASSEKAPKIEDAIALAYAGAGNFGRAFMLQTDPNKRPTLWKLLGQNGDDMAILSVAIPSLKQGGASMEASVADKIAERLLTLGFEDVAATVLNAVPNSSKLLRARVALARGDGTDVFALLSGEEGETAAALRGQALEALSRLPEAKVEFQSVNAAAEVARIERKMQDWQEVGRETSDDWGQVAALLQGEQVTSAEPTLARAAEAANLSEVARLKVEGLLKATSISAPTE